MKKISSMLLAVITLCVLITNTGKASPLSRQEWTSITGYGNVCGPDGSCGGTLELTFNPAGGDVSGSFHHGSTTTENQVTVTSSTNAAFSGYFNGGDGGAASGSISGSTSYSASSPGAPSVSGSYSVSGTWQGHFDGDGSGSGTLVVTHTVNGTATTEHDTWSISYSSEEFMAAMPTATITPTVTRTLTPTQTITIEFTETPELTQTPEGNPPGESLEHESTHKIEVEPSVEQFFAEQPKLDAAMADVFHQDGAIIASNETDGIYAITNTGEKIALPPEIQEMLERSYGFAALQNADLLQASPGVRAFVAQNGQGALDQINGGSGTQYFAMPNFLKSYDYIQINTNCGTEACQPEVSMAALKASFKVRLQPFIERRSSASSEHSSVRGTINGGGDFIFAPGSAGGPELAALSSSAVPLNAQGSNPPYFGLMVEEVTAQLAAQEDLASSSGAIVRMIQAGSPAERAGLQVGDIINGAGGLIVNAEQPLADILGNLSAGETVELTLLRGGSQQTIAITPVMMGNPVIQTPAAEITGGSDAVVVIEIGLNGTTAVVAMEGSVQVREYVTGDTVNVPAGTAVIVVPGYEIGDPINIDTEEITTWWEQNSAPVNKAGALDMERMTLFNLPILAWLAGTYLLFSASLVVWIVIYVREKRKMAGRGR